ncbi:hypothetical protein GOBAR_AA09998 [Gossypium barbadense]|uniref:Uncharacterized protein n=1 Tax=Gossypium barbadense TaxID=3634 RepID=A0A2P5Y4X3_GOSBA|nr:hypothetical protein GOBAR_AA09998 [Gossypium barbadense]
MAAHAAGDDPTTTPTCPTIGLTVVISPSPNPIPVTCCTICLKLAGSAAIKVVRDFFEARGLRLETFPVGGGPAVWYRLGAGSGTGEAMETVKESDIDFCNAIVRVCVSREKDSEIQGSSKRERNVDVSMVARFSDDAKSCFEKIIIFSGENERKERK